MAHEIISDLQITKLAGNGVVPLAIDDTGTVTATTGSATVISSGSNANGEYRIYSDGFKEQWGDVSTTSSGGSPLVQVFPVAFDSPPTNAQVTMHRTRLWNYGVETYAHSETTTTVTLECSANNGSAVSRQVFWSARGY